VVVLPAVSTIPLRLADVAVTALADTVCAAGLAASANPAGTATTAQTTSTHQ
jgi:hypothetical protein